MTSLREGVSPQKLMYGTRCQRISQFYLHAHAFINERNEPHLLLLFQSKLVLICRSRRDGSWKAEFAC